jgi:hypothetical protein
MAFESLARCDEVRADHKILSFLNVHRHYEITPKTHFTYLSPNSVQVPDISILPIQLTLHWLVYLRFLLTHPRGKLLRRVNHQYGLRGSILLFSLSANLYKLQG